MHPDNNETGKQFGLRHGVKFCTGARYIDGFIVDDESKFDWLQDCTSKWEKEIHMIIETAGKYPQENYGMVVRVIQLEWIILQRVTENTGYVFARVEKFLQETLLSHLFFVKSKSLLSMVVTLSTILDMKSGLGLQKPVPLANEKLLSSQRASTELIRAMMREI